MMNRTEQIRSHAGPSLLALAIVHTLLVATSIITGMLLKHDATVVNPYSSVEEARRFFADNQLPIFQAYGLDGAGLLVCAVVVPSG